MIDPELQQLARKRQNRRIALIPLIAVLPWALAALGWFAWRSAHGTSPSPWERVGWPRVLLFMCIPLAILGVELAVFLWLRARGVRWLQPSPAFGLERSGRRRLLRAIRRGERLTGRDGELARDLADRIVRQRWLVLAVLPAALVLEIVFVITHGLDPFGVLVVAASVAALVALPFAWRDVRAARRYLALDPAE